LDVDSHRAYVERNVLLDNVFADLVDEGNDNTFVLNEFERGSGVDTPALRPLIGQSNDGVPAVAGCGTVTDFLPPRQTATVTCPQDPQLRGLRNSVVGYRLIVGEKRLWRRIRVAASHARVFGRRGERHVHEPRLALGPDPGSDLLFELALRRFAAKSTRTEEWTR
jgi:hypothetical protein